MTLRGELARVTGLSNPDAGMGNWALVVEGFAKRVSLGVYRLTDFDQRLAWRCWLLHSRRVSIPVRASCSCLVISSANGN
jgi:hypothetical protein